MSICGAAINSTQQQQKSKMVYRGNCNHWKKYAKHLSYLADMTKAGIYIKQ